MREIHVATVPPDLDLATLDAVLGGLESALLEAGAGRVWVAADRPGLRVMAELPDAPEGPTEWSAQSSEPTDEPSEVLPGTKEIRGIRDITELQGIQEAPELLAEAPEIQAAAPEPA